jgi:outer membrane receptor for ferrienterochelin and colicin
MKNKWKVILIFVLLSILFKAQAQVSDSSMASVYTMTLEELMNTKVTIATKSEQSISKTPSNVTVISSDDIKNMGARELEDVLQTVPGFEIRKRYNGYNGIEIRGVKETRFTSRVLIMINGIPSNQIFYGISLRYGYSINIDDVERIEIIRGPGSALYGRNAISGVINIITKNVKNNKHSFIKGTLGNQDIRDLSGYYGFEKGKFNTSVSFSKVYSMDDYGKYTDEYGLDAPWKLNNNNSNINVSIGYGNFTLSGIYYNLHIKGTHNNSGVSDNIGNYSLSYNKEISPKLHFRSKIYGHNEKEVQDIEQYRPELNVVVPVYKGGNGVFTFGNIYPLGLYFTPQFKDYLFGMEAEMSYKLSFNNDVLFGIQYDVHGVKDVILHANADSSYLITYMPIPGAGKKDQVLFTPGWFKKNGHDYRNMAFYAQDIWYPIKKVGITIGARYDYDSEIGGVFNPRVGLVIEPVNKAYIKLLYGQAYRAPAPIEQYCTFGYSIGNEDLKPEIINTLELVLNYNFDNMSHSLSFFRNRLTNLIYAEARSSIDPTNIYKNRTNTSKGFEYETKIVLAKRLYSYLNYSYTISENTDTINGKDTTYNQPDIAPHKLNLGFNYSFLKYFSINVNMFYRSKMKKFIALDLLSGKYSEVKNGIGDYAVFNSSFQVNNLVKNLNCSVSAFNLFDKKYYSQDSEHWYQPAQLGRQINISVTYLF